jgi:hypothetical protein
MKKKKGRVALTLVILFLLISVSVGCGQRAASAPLPPQFPSREAGYASISDLSNIAVMPDPVTVPFPTPLNGRYTLWLFPLLPIHTLLHRRSRLLSESRLMSNRVAAQQYVGYPHHAPPVTLTKLFLSRTLSDKWKLKTRGCLVCYG